MNNKKISIIVQHFHGCPNGPKMLDIVRDAIKPFTDKITFEEQIIETEELAQIHKFRGSPTLLIEGKDIENMPEPENPSLACRFYKSGLPTVEMIREQIISNLK